ncbi:MAG: tetratricopeptide repeat protein [Acidobacteria bacterium]|nr:tetratricopeptide repeat protein [Acidobacteriota bacterium]
MAKRRISRKQIKEKDQFLTKAEKFSMWLVEQGWKKVVLIITAFAVVLLVAIIFDNISHNKNMKASVMYSEALDTFVRANAASPAQFIQNADEIKKAAEEFDKVKVEYGSTIYGQMAAYYRVLCYFKINEEEKGLEEARKLFDDSSEDIVKNLVGFFLLDRYEKDENWAQAREIADEMKDDMNSMLNPSEILFRSGELYEKEGKITEATDEYMKVLDFEDFSSYRRDAQQRLAIINPVALKEKYQKQQ